MVKNVKVCILRATHNGQRISDEACIQMMMTGPGSVFRYWSDTTGGYLDFEGSALQPWVDIPVASMPPAAPVAREVTGLAAFNATRALPGGAVLDGFDAYVVLLHPGTFPMPNPAAGQPGQPATLDISHAGGAGYSLNGKPACTLPVIPNSHTYFCHEVGHILGLDHSFGLLNDGNDGDGRPPYVLTTAYGDPVDMMSAETFATRNDDPSGPRYRGSPVFVPTLPTGWPNPQRTSAGPMMSRAGLHHWDPQSIPPDKVVEFPWLEGSQVVRFRLGSASRTTPFPTLAVFRPPGEAILPAGEFRTYVEYRTADGWDRGLETTGDDLARQGVFVHQLMTEGAVTVNWYRGRIVVPLGPNQDVAPRWMPFTFRVIDVEDNLDSVGIEVSLSPERKVDLDVDHATEAISTTGELTFVDQCGDELVSATRQWRSTTSMRLRVRGYARVSEPWVKTPSVTWTVGGLALASDTGTLSVPTPGGFANVGYAVDLDAARLTLTHEDTLPVTVPVEVAVSEPGGDYRVVKTATMTGLGAVTGLSEDDQARLTACIARLVLGGTIGEAGKLVRLSKDLLVAKLPLAATDAMTGAVTVYQAVATASPADPHARLDVANAQHTLTVRLLEVGRLDEAAPMAAGSIAHYTAAAALPVAPGDPDPVPPACIRELTLFSRLLAGPLPAPAAQAQYVAVTLMRAESPPTTADGLIRLADALSTLTVRLLDAHRNDEALAAAQESRSLYVDAAEKPNADLAKISGELLLLSRLMAQYGRPEEAARAQRAAVKVLRAALEPTSAAHLALADALSTLTVRELAAGERDRAESAAEDSIAEYRRAADRPDPDLAHIVRELRVLAQVLVSVGLDALAGRATSLADDLE